MATKYYFYQENLSPIKEIVLAINKHYPIPILNCEIYSQEYIKLSLLSHDSEIILKREDYEGDLFEWTIPAIFEINGDMTILSLLFNELGILFYDEAYKEEIKYLNEDIDFKYCDVIIRKYIIECMMHHGIIKSENDINSILYNNKEVFCNVFLLDKARFYQVRKIEKELKKKKNKLLLVKIKAFFSKLFTTKNSQPF